MDEQTEREKQPWEARAYLIDTVGPSLSHVEYKEFHRTSTSGKAFLWL